MLGSKFNESCTAVTILLGKVKRHKVHLEKYRPYLPYTIKMRSSTILEKK